MHNWNLYALRFHRFHHFFIYFSADERQQRNTSYFRIHFIHIDSTIFVFFFLSPALVAGVAVVFFVVVVVCCDRILFACATPYRVQLQTHIRRYDYMRVPFCTLIYQDINQRQNIHSLWVCLCERVRCRRERDEVKRAEDGKSVEDILSKVIFYRVEWRRAVGPRARCDWMLLPLRRFSLLFVRNLSK